MTRRRRVTAGLVALGLLAGLGWWWLRDGGSATGADSGRTARGRTEAGRLARHTTPGAPRWLGQPGVALRRVAGRVTYAGAPVAGASVTLELSGLARRAMPAVIVKSGADGTFDLGPQVAVPVHVSATAPGRATGGVAIDLRDPTLTPAPDHLELVLGDCAHSVSGVVHDHGGAIPGATVRATSRGNVVATTLTGDDGAYQLCLAPGGAWMAVAADGYAGVELPVDGGKHERRDIELSPEGLMAGRVVGPDEAPVAGALVTARSFDIGPFMVRDAAATSDGEGRFTIGGVPPGRYALGARDVGLASAEEVEAVAQVGEPGDEVVLRLEAAVVVHGRVIEGDKPVAGARISHLESRGRAFMPRFSAEAEAVSQADGRFVLDGVSPGPFRIEVAEYELIEPTAPVAALPETELTVKVAGKARVSGRVTREGKPVAGANVNVLGGERGGGTDMTDADGTYEVGGLDPGAYEIGAQAETAFARKAPITVAKGQRLEGVDIELDLAGEISGVVVDQRGDPVGGVMVSFEMGPGVDWGFGTTEADGSFVAGAMSGGGEYAVSVRPNGSSPLQFAPAGGGTFPRIALTDGRSRATGVRIAIQLDRKQISGVVVHQGGKPAADIRVSAFAPDENAERAMMLRWSAPAASATTSADGSFRLEGLLAGSYTLLAADAIGLEVIEKNVAAGRSNLHLTLPASGTIEGELVGFGDKARVIANPMKSVAPLRGRVERNRFTFRGVPPGPYLVAAQDGARSDQEMVEVEGGKTITIKLASEGTARVSGRAIDVVTRAPMAGFECVSRASWGGGESVTTDGDGRFEIEVPARKQAPIVCRCRTGFRGGGSAEVVLEPGARAEIVVEVVVLRRVEGDFGDIGLRLANDKPPRVEQVTHGGPAERAGVAVGDAVLKVDGVAAAALEPGAAYMLMHDHKIGEKVELVLGRGGRESAAAVEVVERSRTQ